MRALWKLTITAFACLMILSLPALASDESYDVLLLVPAVGDKSYFDSAVNGLSMIEEAYKSVRTTVKAMGRDDVSLYDAFFLEAAGSRDYDLIVTGGGECTEALLKAARAYPDQLFFDFDYQDTYGNNLGNIYGVYYRSSDIGYLAGYLASRITLSGMPGANPEPVIGVVLGMDLPDLNDYAGSFCQAAIDNGVRALVGYAGTFSDPAPAYRAAMEMYDAGCDVVWGVAGSAGLGVFEAAADTGHYSFGVDVDQTLTVDDGRLRETIVTSFYKDYAAMILRAFTMLMDGNYPGGVTEEIGLKDGGAGFADNAQYQEMVPEDIRESVMSLGDTVRSGKITPYSVLEDPSRWDGIRSLAAAYPVL